METKITIAIILAALGIAVPGPDFIGGAILGIAGAYGTWSILQGNKASLWGTLFTAALICTVAAIVHSDYFPGTSLHLVMFVSGVLSRYVMLAFTKFGESAVERAGKIPGSFKFPWEKE